MLTPTVPNLSKAQAIVSIGNKTVGSASAVYTIAEIGNNHNGDYFLAKKLIESAVAAGADAVKFQKRFISETFTKELRDKPQLKDQVLGATYGEYREKLELDLDSFKKLKAYADELGVTFFATPFDIKSVDFLEEVGQIVYKIASFDVTNIPLLEKVAKLGKPIILSSGMSTIEELDEAVATILEHNSQLIILYCISIYPTPDEHMNLATYDLMKERYAPIPVGYSGHEKDILGSILMMARGAVCIERHFTIDKNLPGPDHATVSLEPTEFANMVEAAKRIKVMNGVATTGIHEIEQSTRNKHSKSLTAKVDITAGTHITREMITTKSPGTGLKPNMLEHILGKVTLRQINADTTITPDMIEGLE